MTITIEKLIVKMKEHRLSLPSEGRGMGGRVLAADLESTLGDYYLQTKYKYNHDRKAHCILRRQFIPMKAYRYDKLSSDEEKKLLFEDKNAWIAEKKFNGWRVMITYRPYSGFAIWGGNVSDKDFLPVDYTDHILLAGLHPSDKSFVLRHSHPFVIDAEVLCYDEVEGDSGLFSSGTLDAVGIILGGKAARAVEMQRSGDASLIFECFDCIVPPTPNLDNVKIPLMFRKEMLADRLQLFGELYEKYNAFTQFQYADSVDVNKKQFLNHIWAQGDEGIVLKDDTKPYVSGSRLRTHAIKVKRTMSGEIGDDIDAFISGFVRTAHYDELFLIAGIKLSVYLLDDSGGLHTHHVATVTAMSDEMRDKLSLSSGYNDVFLNPEHLNKVLVVDGQELSSKNQRLQHARVDWERGFRKDKNHLDCTMRLKQLEEEKF